MLGACDGPAPAPDDPSISLVKISSVSAAPSSFGVSFTVPTKRELSGVSVSIELPRGVSIEPWGAPAGATYTGVKRGKASWTLDRVDGPAVVGPFVLRADGSDPASPKGASVSWSGGSAKTAETKSRIVGLGSGYGVLRPTSTGANILIGHDTEITGYAMSASIIGEANVTVSRGKVEMPPPDAASETATVVSTAVQVEPKTTSPILLELTAPRPLPPYAPLLVERGDFDGNLGPTAVQGRVGPLGDRVFLPVPLSGNYRLSIGKDWYRRGTAPMSSQVLSSRVAASSRASFVAPQLKREILPALGAVDSDVATQMLAVARADPAMPVITDPIPPGLSFYGLGECSTVACIGTSSVNGEVNFCDLAAEITQCVSLEHPNEDVTVTVSGRDPLFQYCSTNLCFVPGRGIVDDRPPGEAVTRPVSYIATEEQILWLGDPVAA